MSLFWDSSYLVADVHGYIDLTQAEVRRQLIEEEKVAVEQGGAVLHETTASAFLATGMMLEESQ